MNEIYVNSSHIISVTYDQVANESMINERKSLGLLNNVRFSKLFI